MSSKTTHLATGPASRTPFWSSTALRAAFLLVATLLVYWPSYRAGFIWDDATMITANPLVKAGWDGLRDIWFSTWLPDYFPLTFSSLWLEWRLWGLHATGYHVTNILLHAFSSLVLWRVLSQLEIPGAWVAALLFALHPVNVESVAWIAERKNTLALLFFALALLAYLRSEAAGESGAERSPRSAHAGWYSLAIVLFLLALLSKTSVVMFPLVLLGCAWWQRGRIAPQDWVRSLPFFSLSLLLGLVTVWFQYSSSIGKEVVNTSSLPARLAGAGRAVWFYLGKALWPANLTFIYPRWQIDAHSLVAFLPDAALLVVFWVCWHFRKGWGRPCLFALGYYVLALLPALGFLNIYFMKYSLVADHWQDRSLIGLAALASGALKLKSPALLSQGTAAGLVLVLSVLTWRQCRIYADAETLWRDTLAKNPTAWLAHGHLGNILADQGKFVEAGRHYWEVLRLNPGDANAHYKLGNLLGQQGELTEAVSHYRSALEQKPDFAEAHYQLAKALLQLYQLAEARVHLAAAARCGLPSVERRAALAADLAEQGLVPQALAEYRQVLRLRPDWAEVLNNLAWLLATHPEPAMRNGAEAVAFAHRACRATGNTNISLLTTLAAAYAEAGRYPEAVATQQRACGLAAAQGQTAQAERFQRRLELYRSGQAYHEP